MAFSFSSSISSTEAPPVMEARRWIENVKFPPERPLINVSQAAPVAPPPKALRAHMATLLQERDDIHLYGPVLGLPELREEIATEWSADYGGAVKPENVAITAGCNEAFAATISVLAEAGDEIILPTPWYFNHAMWLNMAGITAVPLNTDDQLRPSPDDAERLITSKTRAIVLVTPNNPGGTEYDSETLSAFRDLARKHAVALIVDETYRDFHSQSGAPHNLFADEDWDDVLIQLYSFSKSFRLTGHRVGAIVAGSTVMAQIEKFLDTVTICPPQLGQHAALWGMQNLSQWLAGERAEILSRRAAMEQEVDKLNGWQLRGAGAYFAYLRHPFDVASSDLAKQLVKDAGILMLPGTMFRPESDTNGAQEMRIAFANIDATQISQLIERLARFHP